MSPSGQPVDHHPLHQMQRKWQRLIGQQKLHTTDRQPEIGTVFSI